MRFKKTLLSTLLLSVITTASAIDIVTDKKAPTNEINSSVKNSQNPSVNAVFQKKRNGTKTQNNGVEVKTVTKNVSDTHKQLSSEQIKQIIQIDQMIKDFKQMDLIPEEKELRIKELVERKKYIIEHAEDKPKNKIFEDYKQDVDSTMSSLSSMLGIKIEGLDNVDPKTLTEDDKKQVMEKIRKMFNTTSPLKINYLFAIEGEPGKMILVSENGRFIFQGKIIDTYNGMKELRTIEDIKNYALKANLQKLDVDPDTLSSARIGNGEKEAIFFVDAASSVTTELIDLVNDFPEKDDYTFYFVPTPSDNEKSKDLALRFYCAREAGNTEIGNLLYSGQLEKLSMNKCKMDNFEKTMTAAYYAGVDGLPFLVDYDGSISRGIPAQGLYQWLTEHRNNNVSTNFMPKEVKAEIQSKISEKVTLNAAQQELKKSTNNFEDYKINKNYETKATTDNKAVEKKHEEEEEEGEDLTLDSFADNNASDDYSFNEIHENNASESQKHLEEMQISVEEKNKYTSEQVAHEPFNYKSSKADLNGFDMSDEINRYLNESHKTEAEPLVVEGIDQSSRYEIENRSKAKQNTLSEYSELDTQELNQKKKGQNKHLVNEIEQLQLKIPQIQNEYTYRRQYVKDQYDREYQNLEVVYGIAQNYDQRKRLIKQTEVRRKQAKLFEKYKEKIAKLKDKENEELREVINDINYLKGAMNN